MNKHAQRRSVPAVLAGLGLLAAGASLVPSGAALAESATQAQLQLPMATAVDGSGNLYIADPIAGTVSKVTTTGRISLVAGDGQAGRARAGLATKSPMEPDGVAVDAAGDVFIANGPQVVKVDPSGHLTVLTGALTDAAGVAVDPQGDVYVADAGDNVVYEIAPGGSPVVVAGVVGTEDAPKPGGPAVDSPLDEPVGVALDSAGNLYIADSKNFEIEKVDTSGVLTIVAGENNKPGTPDATKPATENELGDLMGIATDPAGDLFASVSSDIDTDAEYGDVIEIDPAGNLKVVAGSGASAMPQPVFSGSALKYPLLGGAPSVYEGSLYVPDMADSVVEKVDLATETESVYAGKPVVEEWDNPKIKGTYKVGKTLSASRGEWITTGVTVHYQWYAAGKKIAHATGSKLKLTGAMRHKRISVKVTGSKARYASATVTVKGKTVA